MLSEYAFAKLQTINGEEHFIHSLPAALVTSRSFMNTSEHKLQYVPIVDLQSKVPIHMIFYEHDNAIKILSVLKCKIN